MEGDIAAGHIIAKESGCLMIDLVTRHEPEYNKESLRNNYFIVCAGQVALSSIHYPDSSTKPV
jgi:3'-phosphoadenosine 5'-phosphosulfate (PAPS) 3'-phosphatase